MGGALHLTMSIREPGTRETRTVAGESQVLNVEGDLIDHREIAEEAAGYRSTVGSIQFLRAEPGWLSNVATGKFAWGGGMSGLSIFSPLDEQHGLQSSSRIYTADAEEPRVKLQLQW